MSQVIVNTNANNLSASLFFKDILYGIVAVLSGLAVELGTRVISPKPSSPNSKISPVMYPYISLLIQVILAIVVIYFFAWFLFPAMTNPISAVIFGALFLLVQPGLRMKPEAILARFSSNTQAQQEAKPGAARV